MSFNNSFTNKVITKLFGYKSPIHTHTNIYIYISLNVIDIFCLHIFYEY